MGTRAVIEFKDENGTYSVYQHWDGNPDTVLENLKRTRNRWHMPRFEADEFAAAYIATWKTDSGNIRISKGARAHGDLSYVYTVTHVEGARFVTVKYREKYRGSKPRTVDIMPEDQA